MFFNKTIKPHKYEFTSFDGTLHFRPVTEADWDILIPWYRQDNDDELSDDDIKKILRRNPHDFYPFIVEYNKQPCANCFFSKRNLIKMLNKNAVNKKHIFNIEIFMRNPSVFNRMDLLIDNLVNFLFNNLKASAVITEAKSSEQDKLKELCNYGFTILDKENFCWFWEKWKDSTRDIFKETYTDMLLLYLNNDKLQK